MKKLGIFVMCLATAAMTLVGCKKDNGASGETPDQPVIVEDGFYVIGEATVATDFKAANSAIELMGQGLNEVDKQFREGMYEKYIALEGGKDFELILYKAGEETHYGAELKEGEVETDAAPVIALKGQLAKDKKMKVEKSGFYHIILDLNLAEDLEDGAQIIVVPCEWGLRGAMNGWGYSALQASEFNKEKMTFTMKDVLVKADGEFKFAHGNCWKYVLDKQGKVKAENSLGINGTVDGAEECVEATKIFGGGKNFKIPAGYYDITLTWNLTKGAVGESFVAVAKKTADYSLDATSLVLSLIGSSIEEDQNWGTDADLAYEGEAGGVYTYAVANQTLYAGEFKVRMDHEWSTSYGWNELAISGDEANIVDAGNGNIKVEATTTYSKIAFQFAVENNAIKDLKLVFTK